IAALCPQANPSQALRPLGMPCAINIRTPVTGRRRPIGPELAFQTTCSLRYSLPNRHRPEKRYASREDRRSRFRYSEAGIPPILQVGFPATCDFHERCASVATMVRPSETELTGEPLGPASSYVAPLSARCLYRRSAVQACQALVSATGRFVCFVGATCLE